MKPLALSPVSIPSLAGCRPRTFLRRYRRLGQYLLAAIALPVLGQALAQDGEQLLRANACIACHSVDRKLVGPSFREIAKKRAGEEGAARLLADHIINGSSGVYGPIPMPPNRRVSEQDAEKMAQWILSLEEQKK